jgi:NTP pyrophosphatase (non-canonical NTP hydrolase)
MDIAGFQQWTRESDEETGWDALTTPQLLAHLAEEIGEVARAVNRICGYAEGEEQALVIANLGTELLDTLWFLTKLANRFDIDLDREMTTFVERMIPKRHAYHGNLVRAMRHLDRELAAARDMLDHCDDRK